MQMKAQALQLWKVLLKPESQRMPFEGVEIAKSLQRIPVISRFFDIKSQQFINLCMSSSILQFSQGNEIYSQQSVRCIYIILQGRVKVALQNEQIFEEGKHYLSEFGIFGETEILFQLQKRRQKVTVQSQSVKCMVFQQPQIFQLLSSSQRSSMTKALSYLSANQYFQQLSQFQKQQLVMHLSFQSFSKGDCIINQQALVSKVYFIVYGRVAVVKEMQIKMSRGKQQVGKGQKYKIDELSEMDSFGEYECHTINKCGYELIAETNGAYYSLDYQAVKLSNHKLIHIIKQHAIPYPDQEELNFLYSVKNTLKIQQKKIAKKNHIY